MHEHTMSEFEQLLQHRRLGIRYCRRGCQHERYESSIARKSVAHSCWLWQERGQHVNTGSILRRRVCSRQLEPFSTTLSVMEGVPEVDKVQSFIGIVVAIVGNIIISLALNCQKLAHKRLQAEASQPTSQKPTLPSRPSADSSRRNDRRSPRETTPLKPLRSSLSRYSSIVSSRFKISREDSRSAYIASSSHSDNELDGVEVPPSRVLGVVDVANGDSFLRGQDDIEEENDEDIGLLSSGTSSPSEDQTPHSTESDYLKSKLWCVRRRLWRASHCKHSPTHPC